MEYSFVLDNGFSWIQGIHILYQMFFCYLAEMKILMTYV